MFGYKINVIEALKNNGYNSTRILKENILSQSAMQKLRKGEMIGIKTLEQLCDLLELQPGDIIENKPKKD
uniref:helix-turn-helix domain-containing protein n=1 Tax=Agathobacter sp. TaxID=2021311 RepID=UPI004057753F